MSEPLSQSILCPILIGRDAQVAALARLLQQVRSGHGQIALDGIKIQRFKNHPVACNR